jgi:NitT/TauT family transport system permease protein
LSTGLFVGSIFGIATGLLVGYFKKVKQLSEFWLDFFRSLSPAALIPLFLLLFGIGDLAKILLIIFATSLSITISTIYGVSNINATRMMWAKSINLSNQQIFWHIILPESLPYISAGMRHAISFGMMLVIGEEMLMGGTGGLGKKINDYHLILETSSMYAVIILTGILGYTLNKLYLIFENQNIHWAGK